MPLHPAMVLLNGLCQFYDCLAPLWPRLVQDLGGTWEECLQGAQRRTLREFTATVADPIEVARVFADKLSSEVPETSRMAEHMAFLKRNVESVAPKRPLCRCDSASALCSTKLYQGYVSPTWAPVHPCAHVEVVSATVGTESSHPPWQMRCLRTAADDLAAPDRQSPRVRIEVLIDPARLDAFAYGGLSFGLYHEYVSHVHSGLSARQAGEGELAALSPFHDGTLYAVETWQFQQSPGLSFLEEAYLDSGHTKTVVEVASTQVPFVTTRSLLSLLSSDSPDSAAAICRACLIVARADYDCMGPDIADVHGAFWPLLVRLRQTVGQWDVQSLTGDLRRSRTPSDVLGAVQRALQ